MDEITGERKSSFSGSSGGSCVAVGKLKNEITVRDTKQANDANRDMLTFAPKAWVKFLREIRLSLKAIGIQHRC
jgi:hypothetical protein